jgi:diaminopimelate epimerase
MHGCGNDYVVVDAVNHAVPDPEGLARRVCSRRFGIGADGLLLALPGDDAPLRMRMYNADGSEAEMCGNGLRCLVKYAIERGLVSADGEGTVDTGTGRLAYEAHIVHGATGPRVDEVSVLMGIPELERAAIPMTGPPGHVVDEDLEVGGQTLAITAVSMGNPHAVTWVSSVDDVPIERIGPLVEHHPAFPRRTNTEFVEVVSPREVRQRTWERGCGETMACGTGACAVVVAGRLTGRTERDVLVRLRGGDLRIAWQTDAQVRMTGPAVRVFEGRWPEGDET